MMIEYARLRAAAWLCCLLVWGVACAVSPAAPAASGPPRPPSSPAAESTLSPVGAGVSTRQPEPSPPPPPAAPVPVRIGNIGTSALAGVYVAVERGYFAAEGLAAELVPFRSGQEQLAPLATGELELGFNGAEPSVFNAAARGVGVKIVASSSLVGPDDRVGALLVRQDLVEGGQFRGLADLKGLNVAINTEGANAQRTLEAILAQGGLALADVRITTIPFGEMVTTLANRGIDAAWTFEPFLTFANEQRIAQSVITAGQVVPGDVATVLIMSPLFAERQPEAARRAVTAWLRGQRDYYRAFVSEENPGDRDAIIAILTKDTPIKDPAMYARMGMHAADPNGALDEQALDRNQTYFVSTGAQTRKIDPREIIDLAYLDYAVARLGRVGP